MEALLRTTVRARAPDPRNSASKLAALAAGGARAGHLVAGVSSAEEALPGCFLFAKAAAHAMGRGDGVAVGSLVRSAGRNATHAVVVAHAGGGGEGALAFLRRREKPHHTSCCVVGPWAVPEHGGSLLPLGDRDSAREGDQDPRLPWNSPFCFFETAEARISPRSEASVWMRVASLGKFRPGEKERAVQVLAQKLATGFSERERFVDVSPQVRSSRPRQSAAMRVERGGKWGAMMESLQRS